MSPDETALRAAVAAAPDAALPRLVLADYLDDQNQPTLAAALRLDVALAAERPWADRYWQLKAEQPPDFPADLGRLSDRQPLLCGVPDDWRSRWRAVRAFVSRWWNVPLGDVGRWGAAVVEAERSASRRLPPGVKEWVTFTAELFPAGITGYVGDRLDVHRPVGFEMVVLLREYMWAVYWVPDDESIDPAVSMLSDDRPWSQQTSHRFADTTAGFALLRLLQRHADQRTFAAGTDYHATLAAAFPSVGRFDSAEVFEAPGRVAVVLRPGSWLYGDGVVYELPRKPVPASAFPLEVDAAPAPPL